MSSKLLANGDSCVQHSFGFSTLLELAKISPVCKTFNKLATLKVAELLKSKYQFFTSSLPAQQNEFMHTAFGRGAEGYRCLASKYYYANFLKCAEFFRKENLKAAFTAFDRVPASHGICFGSVSGRDFNAEFPFDDQFTNLRHMIFYEHYLLVKDQAPADCFNYGELAFFNKDGHSSTGAQKAEAMERVVGKILQRWTSFKPIFCFNRFLLQIVEPHKSRDTTQKLRNETYGHMYRLLGSPRDVADNFGEVAFNSANTVGTQKWKAIEDATRKLGRDIELFVKYPQSKVETSFPEYFANSSMKPSQCLEAFFSLFGSELTPKEAYLFVRNVSTGELINIKIFHQIWENSGQPQIVNFGGMAFRNEYGFSCSVEVKWKAVCGVTNISREDLELCYQLKDSPNKTEARKAILKGKADYWWLKKP